jgi:two-component sensor histidine kinase
MAHFNNGSALLAKPTPELTPNNTALPPSQPTFSESDNRVILLNQIYNLLSQTPDHVAASIFSYLSSLPNPLPNHHVKEKL